jgi:hypothetical protein
LDNIILKEVKSIALARIKFGGSVSKLIDKAKASFSSCFLSKHDKTPRPWGNHLGDRE